MIEKMDSTEKEIIKMAKHTLLTREEELELFDRYKNGDVSAKDEIVKHNIRLVYFIAKKHSKYTLEVSDLFQSGFIGLYDAIEKFDVTNGARFSTYAIWHIRHRIQQEIFNMKFSTRIPDAKYRKKIMLFTSSPNTRDMTETIYEYSERVSKEINAPINETYKTIYKKAFNDQSIDCAVEGRGYFVRDLITDKNSNPEDILLKKEKQKRLESAMGDMFSCISPREKEVLIRRHGDEREYLQEIADDFDMTRERVRQIEVNVLGKLSKKKKYLNILDEDCIRQSTSPSSKFLKEVCN
jgi:RNA polymerase sigma-32 factor